MTQADDLVNTVRQAFEAQANAAKAKDMAAYMKTDQAFFGVQKPTRTPTYRAIKKTYKPTDQAAYEANVRALWREPEREMQYSALEYAAQHRAFIGPDSMELYEQLIREGAWWDLVDPVATNLVGAVFLKHREPMKALMEQWIEDEDMWIRRSALIAHNKHKSQVDQEQLFRHCLARAHETEFFIRKAIGWVLREYSYAAPETVKGFLLANKDKLSGLSFREGGKRLKKLGLL